MVLSHLILSGVPVHCWMGEDYGEFSASACSEFQNPWVWTWESWQAGIWVLGPSLGTCQIINGISFALGGLLMQRSGWNALKEGKALKCVGGMSDGVTAQAAAAPWVAEQILEADELNQLWCASLWGREAWSDSGSIPNSLFAALPWDGLDWGDGSERSLVGFRENGCGSRGSFPKHCIIPRRRRNTGLEGSWIVASSGWKSWLLLWTEMWRFVPWSLFPLFVGHQWDFTHPCLL